MQVPEEYFKREIRDDFEVSPMMKRVWAAELKVLSEVDRICEMYGIRYFADYGTLIGAVRHKGFIPWDDDIDVCMLRADYMKFLSIAERELPDSYILHTYFKREDHKQPFTVVMNRETIGTGGDDITNEHYGCPFVIGVEIYPLDYVPRDPEEVSLLKTLYGYVYDCGQHFYDYQENGTLDARLDKIREYAGVTIGEANMPLVQEVRCLADRIAMMYTEEESDHLLTMYDLAIIENPILRDKKWYSDAEYLPYEYMMIPVPVGYTKYLTKKYGDYMTPVRFVGAHDYPFYKVQLPYLPEDYRKKLEEEGEL